MKIPALTRNLCLVIIPALMAIGCSSTGVRKNDAAAVKTVNIDFGSAGLQQAAGKMVDSLLTFPHMAGITRKRRPVMYVDRFKNKTSEQIDTISMTGSMSSRLLGSGKFRLVDPAKVAAVHKKMHYQADSPMTNQHMAIAVGRQTGAEYMMFGNLSGIVKRNNKTKDMYFRLTLKVMHLKSGIVEWSEEQEIRKAREKSWLGF